MDLSWSSMIGECIMGTISRHPLISELCSLQVHLRIWIWICIHCVLIPIIPITMCFVPPTQSITMCVPTPPPHRVLQCVSYPPHRVLQCVSYPPHTRVLQCVSYLPHRVMTLVLFFECAIFGMFVLAVGSGQVSLSSFSLHTR